LLRFPIGGRKKEPMSYPTPQNNQPASDSALPVLSLVFAFLVPIAGAIMGHIALGQIDKGQIIQTNRSLAKAAVILGWILTGLTVLVIALYGVFIAWLVGEGYDLYM
jgi:SNF family Na+-dependent transporter